MLSETMLIISTVALALASPIVAVFLFFQGYKLGVKDFNRAHSETPKALPKRRPRRPQGENKRREQLETILDNIENYDGTSAHQKEID